MDSNNNQFLTGTVMSRFHFHEPSHTLNTHKSVTVLNRTHVKKHILFKMSWFVISFSLCTSSQDILYIQDVTKRLDQMHDAYNVFRRLRWWKKFLWMQVCKWLLNELWANVFIDNFIKVMIIINSYSRCWKWSQSAWMHASARQISDWWTILDTPGITRIPTREFWILSKALLWSVLLGLGKPCFFFYMSPIERKIMGFR
jgi:hypothetical protein